MPGTAEAVNNIFLHISGAVKPEFGKFASLLADFSPAAFEAVAGDKHVVKYFEKHGSAIQKKLFAYVRNNSGSDLVFSAAEFRALLPSDEELNKNKKWKNDQRFKDDVALARKTMDWRIENDPEHGNKAVAVIRKDPLGNEELIFRHDLDIPATVSGQAVAKS